MKLKAPDAVVARARSPINWFLGICLAAFLTIIFASAAVPPPSAEELNAAERWVVERVTAGKEADLSRQFPEEKDRKLSAHFLEDLLTGALAAAKLERHGVQIGGAIIKGELDLSDAQIPCRVRLEQCQFGQSVSFSRAVFAGAASFSGSTFHAGADFSTSRAANDLFFERTIFEGPVFFVAANIGNALLCNGAQFKDEAQGANFNNMVSRAVFLRGAVFSGPVNFGSANIGTHFEADGAQFINSAKEANFNDLHCGALELNNALFKGLANFGSAEIATNFDAEHCQFQGKPDSALLNVIRCGALGWFEGVGFAGRVSFLGSNFLDLMIENAQPDGAVLPELNLSGSSIKRRLYVEKVKIQTFEAQSLHVEGPTKLTELTISGAANLSYSDFFTLDLSGSTWPKDASSLDIKGMTYKYIRAASDELASHKALIRLADQAAYNPEVYNGLETFFSRLGYQDDADRAFIEGKRRERRQLHGIDWVGSFVVDTLSGFGRRKTQALIPCVLIVWLGCILFSPRKMEPQEPNAAPQVYNRFWYSLGLFFPLVDLRVNKAWQPKADQTLLRNYVPIHILLGWILVSIAFAVGVGVIK